MSKHLSLALIALFCAVYQIDASFTEVQDKFILEEIVPDVIADFPEPKTELKISFPSGVKVELGNVLTPTQVKDQPKVEWDAEDGALYTLLMTDPDAPSRKEPTRREFRHWLTINIPGNDLSSGDALFQYIGSGPPLNTGLHRYVFLLFKQTKERIESDLPHVPDNSTLGRPSTSTRELIKEYDLEIVGGNFFLAENEDNVTNFAQKIVISLDLILIALIYVEIKLLH